MSKIKKSLIIVTSIVLVISISIYLLIGVGYVKAINADSSGTLVESTYHMDDKYEFLKDIPFDRYLKDTTIPLDKTVFDIRNYGADVSNTPLLNHEAIIQAIDEASKVNGVVLVDGGIYRTKRLELKSNITLRIEKDSALENLTYDEAVELNLIEDGMKGLLYGTNLENIIIEGRGQLRGNGATYCKEQLDSSPFLPLDTFNLRKYILEHRKRIKMAKTHEMHRDFIIGLNYCNNVTIRNLEIYEAGSWTVRLEGLENVLIEDVVINNDVRVANTDGIDLMGGKNITIRNCFMATGDDGICLKTDPNNPVMDNILIENVEIMSLANPFKIGTAVHQDISNVIFRNSFFFLPGIAGGYAGIAIEAPDGGKVSNILVDNIVMENITSPFVIWRGNRNNGGGYIEGITLQNITATNCDIAGAITGFRKGKEINYVQDVTLRNFDVTYRDALEDLNIYKNSTGAYDGIFNMNGYPEITKVSHKFWLTNELSPYYDLPVYGIFARYVDGLTVENYKVQKRESSQLPFSNFDNPKAEIKNLVDNN